jgi:hypothetical protein
MDFVHKKMQKDRERKALIIDEAWTLLRFAEHSKHIFELIKTARKFGLGILILTQEVGDLISSEAGKTILANTSWKFLARQEPTVIEELSQKFNLNSEEQNYLLTAMPGEGLLFAMNDHIPLKVVPSPSEYELITTNPDEVKARELKFRKLGEKEPENMHPYQKEKKYYLKKELTIDQIEFLKQNDYHEIRLCGLDNFSQWYLVKKPDSSESLEHQFMVQIIADEVLKHTQEVSIYASTGPDILVWVPKKDNPDFGESIALEIETGTQLKTPGDLANKVAQNNFQKYKEWWFVVTNKDDKKEYEKYHQTMTRTEIRDYLRRTLNGK